MSFTDIVNGLIIKYNTSTITNNDIIYDYGSLFNKTYYANSLSNMTLRFEKALS